VQQRWAALAAVISLGLTAVGGARPTAADGEWSPVPTLAGAYVPVAPCRALDTRANGSRRPARSTLHLDLAPCGPPVGTAAVVLTVTAVDPADSGFAVAWPSGHERPMASLVNWTGSGGAVANTGIIQTSADAVSLFVRSEVDLVVDVSGFFVAQPKGDVRAGRFVALPMPARVLDTRAAARPTAGSTTHVALPGESLPPDATAVLVNVTATDSAGASYVAAWGAGERPLASFLNLDGAGQTRAATTITAVADGGFHLYSHAGEHLLVDLIGYFTGPSAAPADEGLFVPLVPTRQLDTRDTGPIYPEGAVEVTGLTGAVFVGNVTMTDVVQPGFQRVLPARRGISESSSVNADRRGATVANFVVSPVSDTGLAVWSKHQSAAVLDQTGYFLGEQLVDTHPPIGNAPPGGPTYPSDGCVAWDPLLDYNLDSDDGAPRPREVRQIGTSLSGRPIWAEYYGPWVPHKTVLVLSGVHGDECGPALVVDSARRTGAASTTVGYWVVPVLNPDGLAAFSRYNAAGIDLNRDGFDVSQPESRALMTITAEIRPDVTVHAHSPYGFVGGFGHDPLAYELAAEIAAVTGLTKAKTAGSNPGAEFLWEGQMFVHPHALLLIELFPLWPDEATVDRPRLPPRTVAEVAEHARLAIAVIHERLD
jgi:hypothetical protein